MYTYKGYTYNQYTDGDEDTTWYIHFAVSPNSDTISLDYTQWERMSEESFKTLVDLDFPRRPKNGNVSAPWDERSLREYAEELEYTSEFTMHNDQLTYL